MYFKKSGLAVAMTLALGLGIAQQATASVYARSYSALSNLDVVLSDDGGITTGGGSVNSFNFNLTNTAFLNGVGAATNAVCSGTTGTNNCSVATPTLDALPANAPGGDINRANNNYSFFGAGTNEYSNADSVIYTAQLTGDAFSSTEQIASVELQSGNSGSSSADITSTTGFTFLFTVAGANQLQITFTAAANFLAAINDPAGTAQNAQANTKLQFTLSSNSGPTRIGVFSPDGAATNECAAVGGVTCTALLDGFDLNSDVGVSTDGTSSGRSTAGSGFSVIFGGLTNGQWSLTLNNVTSTVVSRTVPAPGLLSLMGLGLVGLGVTRRRAINRS
jgi:hypothetical protein